MELRPGYRVTDAGTIPNDWEVRSLKDLIVVRNGFAFSSVNFSDNGRILLTPGNFRLNGGLYFNERNTKRCRGPCPPPMILKYGDLVIVMTDLTPSCDLLGKPAFVQTHEPILHNQRIGKIAAVSNRIALNYLYHFFLSEAHAERMKATATGSTVRHTSNRSIYSSLIALPSTRAEQEAIAEALSDADALIESVNQLIAKKRDIKQAAMQQLLTGKQRLPGFCGEWEFHALGGGIMLQSGHHVLAQYCNTRGVGVPYLTGPSDFPNGTIQQTKFTVRTTTLCARNDILVTVKGSGSGSLVLANAVYCISRQLMAIRVRDWNSRFIYYSLLQNASKIIAASTGLIPGLSRSDILEQPLPLPPTKTEQTAIATILSDMDAELAALERRRDKTRVLKQGMMQELLTGKTRLV